MAFVDFVNVSAIDKKTLYQMDIHAKTNILNCDFVMRALFQTIPDNPTVDYNPTVTNLLCSQIVLTTYLVPGSWDLRDSNSSLE